MPLYPHSRSGIQAVKLEEMERRLRNDLVQEAAVWGGRVMLHAEVAAAAGTTAPAAAPDPAAAATSAFARQHGEPQGAETATGASLPPCLRLHSTCVGLVQRFLDLGLKS